MKRIYSITLALLFSSLVFALHTTAQELEDEISALRIEVREGTDQLNASLNEHVRDELALAVAKVAVNEAGWRSPEDVALIWQVTENRGRTDQDRLDWLTRHSSCVLTNRPMTEREARGNCGWTRHLGDDDLEPEGWPTALSWSSHIRRWRQVRLLARMLVEGHSDLRPCEGTPLTWGGAMDHERALERGLRPVACAGTLNTGFVVAEGDRT